MRLPLVIIAIPILIVGIFGIFITPDAAMRYLEQAIWLAPIKVRLASVVPMVAGNRSLGAVAGPQAEPTRRGQERAPRTMPPKERGADDPNR